MNTVSLFITIFLVLSLGFRLTRLVIAIRKAKFRNSGRTAARPMFWIMTISYVVFLVLCVMENQRRLNAFSWALSFAGLFLYLTSLTLREKAMHDLGRFFSPDIEIRHQHQVVKTGFYRYVRHPLLACMALEIVGLGMVFNAYATLIFVGFGVYMPLIYLRKWLEERTLRAALGEAYRVYEREVGAFWPRWNILSRFHRN
ncbi:MAG: isoprenylcysteine carboxylmethyltransferase family protein [Elusimicrobiota bacterium]|jgi:protein-S-isoprenylcysteine O-methyltransferase Ste14